MYELIQAGKHTYYILCPAKIGVWTCILNPHANANYNGGNTLLQQRLGAPTGADRFPKIKQELSLRIAPVSFLYKRPYFAALAARMASVSMGVTLKRSPQMP